MPLPVWVEVLMYGHRRVRVKPIPPAEFEKWREEQQRAFREGAARLKTTVDQTCEIVSDLKTCVGSGSSESRPTK